MLFAKRSSSDVVKYVARNSVYFRHMTSMLGKNVLVGFEVENFNFNFSKFSPQFIDLYPLIELEGTCRILYSTFIHQYMVENKQRNKETISAKKCPYHDNTR